MQPNVHVEGQVRMTRRLEYRCKACGRRYATNHPRGPRGSARCPVATCQGVITKADEGTDHPPEGQPDRDAGLDELVQVGEDEHVRLGDKGPSDFLRAARYRLSG
jgi:hypothetical protein